jgi:hypothetical protein
MLLQFLFKSLSFLAVPDPPRAELASYSFAGLLSFFVPNLNFSPKAAVSSLLVDFFHFSTDHRCP